MFRSMNIKPLTVAISTLVLSTSLLTACGGGDNTVGSPEILTGIFYDSPVINIGYRTETLKGMTNSQGEFMYKDGENITFFIGDLVFPTTKATVIVTPFELAGTQDITSPRVVNILRLLQTLDKDDIADNGLMITNNAIEAATQVDFSLSIEEFETLSQILTLITNAGKNNIPSALIDRGEAITNFSEALAAIDYSPCVINPDSCDTDTAGSPPPVMIVANFYRVIPGPSDQNPEDSCAVEMEIDFDGNVYGTTAGSIEVAGAGDCYSEFDYEGIESPFPLDDSRDFQVKFVCAADTFNARSRFKVKAFYSEDCVADLDPASPGPYTDIFLLQHGRFTTYRDGNLKPNTTNEVSFDLRDHFVGIDGPADLFYRTAGNWTNDHEFLVSDLVDRVGVSNHSINGRPVDPDLPVNPIENSISAYYVVQENNFSSNPPTEICSELRLDDFVATVLNDSTVANPSLTGGGLFTLGKCPGILITNNICIINGDLGLQTIYMPGNMVDPKGACVNQLDGTFSK